MPDPRAESEWFDRPDPTGETDTAERGLRFTCTQCGNCCSGPPGYVGFTPEEGRAIARTLGVTETEFLERFTRDTPEGRSIKDLRKAGSRSWDCVFLDRTPDGRALCTIYDARPAQCRTWPFWSSVLLSPRTWKGAGTTCPGMNTGTLHPPQTIRVTRDRVDI
ncbi:MAG: zinc/iron-chelating domain-containing protein [Phycisphaeraceae bacterium]|nr:MAG: zinc/iron-chelating domain-containing protein [Phycisphaeraceae bacterium]